MAINIEFPYDEYDRKARLAPALLVIAPLLIDLALHETEWALSGGIGTLSVSLGVLWLVSDIARRIGRSKQKQLFEEWGGYPSVQLLRHSNIEIGKEAKQKYHTILSAKSKIMMPTTRDEKRSQKNADAKYYAAQEWLLQNTRDKEKFKLLFNENITYGYRRNAYGLRPIGIVACVLAIVWTLSSGTYANWALTFHFIESPRTALQLISSVLLACVWVWVFTKDAVKEAAFTYAKELIRACEVLPDENESTDDTIDTASPQA